MPEPVALRETTQLVLPADLLEEFRPALDERFTLTFSEVGDEAGGEFVRVIGSPVEIRDASEFLSGRGVRFQ
ncbi:hypothetical protein [Halorussus lipolyticus]|uniref:VNG_1110C family protein n=1 Tax=Halorussus lipolyticus TaxID=3034024 RepID=UPI0023E88307|nr:hypothetical protein [Halorussus sp. DT80]